LAIALLNAPLLLLYFFSKTAASTIVLQG